MARLILISVLLLSLLHDSEAQVQSYNRNDPSLRGLVAWYIGRAGLAHGARWYDAAGRLHGTFANGASWAASSRPQSQYEVRFDGSDDLVSVAAHAALDSPYRTIAFWMKAPGGGADYQSLVGYQNATNYFNSYWRPGTPDHYHAVYFKTTAGENAIDTAAGLVIPTGVWVHLAVTYDGTAVRTYRNCAFNQSFASSGTLVASSSPLLFAGATSGTAASFAGALDDIRVYNRALAAQDLCTIMRQSPQQVFAPPSMAALLPSVVAPSGLLPFFPQGAQ